MPDVLPGVTRQKTTNEIPVEFNRPGHPDHSRKAHILPQHFIRSYLHSHLNLRSDFLSLTLYFAVEYHPIWVCSSASNIDT